MAPRKSIPRDRFAALFVSSRTQTYHDPATRLPGSHSIRSIAWNPTGHLIASGSVDRTLRIWNPEKPQVKNSTELRGHTGAIERVAFNPVLEAELASVSSDGTCRFWDVRSKACISTVQLGGEGLTVTWAEDGSVCLVGRKDDHLVPINISDRSYAVQPSIPQATQTNQTIFTWSSPPQTLLTTTSAGKVKMLDWPSLKLVHTLHGHTSSCTSLALSPVGRYLATGGSDALICLWDTTDWVCRRTLAAMTGAVRSVSFSWDGSYIVGGSDEGNGLDIAHVESGDYVTRVETTQPASCVAWHPNRYWLAYSGDSAGLKIVGAAGGV